MSRFINSDVTLEEVTKIYIHRGKAIAFDTTLYHIRGENIERSKTLSDILHKLTEQVLDGTATVPVHIEE